MNIKLHERQPVDIDRDLHRYAVPGGWLYVHTTSHSNPGSWGWGRAAMVFVPDTTIDVGGVT